MIEEPSRKLPTIIIMMIGVTSLTFGDLVMSLAMRRVGPVSLAEWERWRTGEGSVKLLATEIYHLGWAIFTEPLIWLGIGCLLVFLVLWIVSLSWSDLTFVMPLTALTYVLNAILVGPFLGEVVTPLRWLGTALIAIGVMLVSIDSGKAAAEKSDLEK